MMNSKLVAWTIALNLLPVTTAISIAQQPDTEGMKKWIEFMQPGESHELLAKRVGNWDLSIKMWMLPDQPPSESKLRSEIRMIMGGRYLVESVEGEFEGSPFEGQNTIAFDNGTKEFISTWIDSMSTGVIIGHGSFSAEKKEFHFKTRFTDPMTHKPTEGRSVERMIDDNTWITQSYKTTSDGKEFMDMEITYRRMAH